MENTTSELKPLETFNPYQHSALDRIRSHFPATTGSTEDWLNSTVYRLQNHQTTAHTSFADPSDPPLHAPHLTRLPSSLQSSRLRSSVRRSELERRRPLQTVEPNRASQTLKRRMPNDFDKGSEQNSSRRVTRGQERLSRERKRRGGGDIREEFQEPGVILERQPSCKAQQGSIEKLHAILMERVQVEDQSKRTRSKGREADLELRLVGGGEYQEENVGESDDCVETDQARNLSRIFRLQTSDKLDPRPPCNTGNSKASSSKSASAPSERTGSSSPNKRAVDKRTQMRYLNPPVKFVVPQLWDLGGVSAAVTYLWRTYIRRSSIGTGIIPISLQAQMNSLIETPNKRNPTIPAAAFATTAPYSDEDCPLLMSTVRRTLENANIYRNEDCTETHWMAKVVHPLLDLVCRLQQFQGPQGGNLVRSDDMGYVRMQTNICPTSSDSYFTSLKKQIDGALGIKLTDTQRDILDARTYASAGLPCINPAENFTQLVPQFLFIETKRPHTNKDPLIQLGMWIAAEFTKRRLEGWRMDIPVLAVEIEGDVWSLYEAYAMSRKASRAGEDDFVVTFVGPQDMGTTGNHLGIFQILDWLCRCVDWGLKDYRTWIEEEILQVE